MNLARRIFNVAAIWGFLVLTPMYFLENRIGRSNPPPLTHPEYFYGFIGVALAWQLAFFLIASDPQKYRPFMILAALEKVSFGVACLILFYLGRVDGSTLVSGGVDIMFGGLFCMAYRITGKA